MIDLDALIKSANEIDPLPATAARLVGLTANDAWSWKQVVEVIKLDPIMVTRLLRLANSAAYYSANGPIVSIGNAVTKLGISNVLAVAIASGVSTLLSAEAPELGWGKNRLWRNAVAASLVPDTLSLQLSIQAPKEASTAALLHNIGILILRRYLKSRETSLLKKTLATTGDIYAAESELFNMNHAQIGGIILQKWNLPQTIVDLVIYHNKPNEHPGRCTDLVYLAYKIAGQIVPSTLDPDVSDIDAGVFERLQLSEEQYNATITIVTEHLEEIMSIYA
jgi:HD-like signal output (HDOD) protein